MVNCNSINGVLSTYARVILFVPNFSSEILHVEAAKIKFVRSNRHMQQFQKPLRKYFFWFSAHEVTVKCSFPSCCEPFAPQDGYCRLTSWANTSYSSWGKWSAWGDCLGSKCGGCALRARIRACEDDSCV